MQSGLRFVMLSLDVVLLEVEVLCRFLLLILQGQRICLGFQGGLLLMGCLLKCHELMVVLLVQSHLLCLELLIDLQIKLRLLLRSDLLQIIFPLLVLLIQYSYSFRKLLLEAHGIRFLLFLNGRNIGHPIGELLWGQMVGMADERANLVDRRHRMYGRHGGD